MRPLKSILQDETVFKQYSNHGKDWKIFKRKTMQIVI